MDYTNLDQRADRARQVAAQLAAHDSLEAAPLALLIEGWLLIDRSADILAVLLNRVVAAAVAALRAADQARCAQLAAELDPLCAVPQLPLAGAQALLSVIQAWLHTGASPRTHPAYATLPPHFAAAIAAMEHQIASA